MTKSNEPSFYRTCHLGAKLAKKLLILQIPPRYIGLLKVLHEVLILIILNKTNPTFSQEKTLNTFQLTYEQLLNTLTWGRYSLNVQSTKRGHQEQSYGLC